MEHPILFLNKLFEVFGAGDFAHAYPHVIYSWLAMVILVVLGKLATTGISMVPSGLQGALESVIDGLENFSMGIMGEDGRPFFPLICTLFLYIFLCNLMGLAPGLYSPTANLNTTASMAIVVFIVFQAIGIRRHGIKYIKHFMGPVWWMAPLMIPIEIIGHLARVLSLSFRLFGNIFAEELVLAILLTLAGKFLAPVVMLPLFVFNSFVQAFIFTILTIMYITGSLEEAH